MELSQKSIEALKNEGYTDEEKFDINKSLIHYQQIGESYVADKVLEEIKKKYFSKYMANV